MVEHYLKNVDDSYDSLNPEDKLSEFVKLFKDAKARYDSDLEMERDLDVQTQDILHMIELTDTRKPHVYAESFKKIREIRQERRKCKAEIEMLTPLINYSNAHAMEIKNLERVLGDVRKAKELIARRGFSPRNEDIGQIFWE